MTVDANVVVASLNPAEPESAILGAGLSPERMITVALAPRVQAIDPRRQDAQPIDPIVFTDYDGQ